MNRWVMNIIKDDEGRYISCEKFVTVRGHAEGPPKPVGGYSEKELLSAGHVGLYATPSAFAGEEAFIVDFTSGESNAK